MFDKVSSFLFQTTSGRILLVVLGALLAGYGARIVLVDLPAMEAKEAAGVGSASVERMADALAEAVDEAPDLDKTFPELTSWYPENIPCGADAPMTTPRDKIWDVMKMPSSDTRTEFQYRFQKVGERVRIIARRDSDCDGHFAVWQLEQRTSGLLGREITAQNIQE